MKTLDLENGQEFLRRKLGRRSGTEECDVKNLTHALCDTFLAAKASGPYMTKAIHPWIEGTTMLTCEDYNGEILKRKQKKFKLNG